MGRPNPEYMAANSAARLASTLLTMRRIDLVASANSQSRSPPPAARLEATEGDKRFGVHGRAQRPRHRIRSAHRPLLSRWRQGLVCANLSRGLFQRPASAKARASALACAAVYA